MSRKAKVVIVGRVNVGKSTLFNRLSRRVKSITLDFEGVTRDYLHEEVAWLNARFDLIDSGGIHLRKTQDALFESVRKQVLDLVSKADVLVFMVDGTVGLLPEDREIARHLHLLNIPTIVLINKIDSSRAQENEHEFIGLGFDTSLAISAEHGKGISELLDTIVRMLPKEISHAAEPKPAYSVMLLGKPNVGKSSLMNEILQKERSLVSEVPGTTREALAEQVSFYKEVIGITDTPGIRRKSAISGEELETLMVKSAFRAMRKSQIVLLLIDGASDTLVDQELKLAFYVFQEQYKSLIILINKDDLVTESSKKGLEDCFELYDHLIKKVPVLSISCKTGKNIGKVVPLIDKVWERSSLKMSDVDLRRICLDGLRRKPLYHKKLPLLVYKVRQLSIAPLTIELVVNESEWFGPSQLTFFENLIRSEYDIIGVPIKFIVKKRREKKS